MGFIHGAVRVGRGILPLMVFLAGMTFTTFAQHEISMRDGTRVEGKVLTSEGTALRVKVFLKSRGDYTEVMLEKESITRIWDVVSDRDVTRDFLGGPETSPATRPTDVAPPPMQQPISPAPSPAPVNDATNAHQSQGQNRDMTPLPREHNSPPVASRRGGDIQAEIKSFPRSETFNGEIGASALLIHYFDYPSSAENQFALIGDFVYSFHPLAHNARYPTRASKMAIPKGFLGAELTVGPTYKDGPDHLTFRASGAGLVSKNIAIGAALLVEDLTQSVSYYWQDIEFTTSEFAVGGFIDIFASRSVMLRELFAIGSITQSLEDSRSSFEESYATTRFEHTLAARAGNNLGYIHQLYVTMIEDSPTRIIFNHFLEIATTSRFSLEPQLRIQAYVSEGDHPEFLLGAGIGFNVYLSPRAVLQFVPLFQKDPDASGGGALSIQGRVGIRF
jgi:hypothetical protein